MYIFECSNHSTYVGSTWNLDGRVEQHDMGKASSTPRLAARCGCCTWRSTRELARRSRVRSMCRDEVARSDSLSCTRNLNGCPS
ncbi:GIY-YIG nuclease family protein [Microbacterium pygmaeum]|uniref:GIY-YIG nuclease family protein n=1 Tax=Microbacterium pygmaeum TaxID=370764 RepID=UPI0018D33B03